VSGDFVDRKLVNNDELTASKWVLKSAVECYLHTLTVDPPAVDYKEVR